MSQRTDALIVTIDALIAQRDKLRQCLQSILNHVEDEKVERVGGQCTLCHAYRMKGHYVLAETKP